MAAEAISTDPVKGEVLVRVGRHELKVKEDGVNLYRVLPPHDLEAGSSILVIACHVAAEALAEARLVQPSLF